MSNIELKVEDWAEWAQHSCTQDFILSLKDEQNSLIKGIIYNAPDGAREQLIGQVKAIDLIIGKIQSLSKGAQ